MTGPRRGRPPARGERAGKNAGSPDAHLRAMELLDLVCHDLRTPACTIAGFADLLLDFGKTPLTGEQRASLERIRKNAQFMLELVGLLADMIRLDTGRLKLAIGAVDLRELVRETTQGALVVASAKQIFVMPELPEERLVAEVDRGRILQVLGNLVSNAVKFSRPGTTVLVGARGEGEGVLVWVTDEGPGVPAKDRERLFTKFAKLSVKPTGGEKSTGLGLYIVKELVQLHGGSVELESAGSEGSTFRVWLPAVTRYVMGQE